MPRTRRSSPARLREESPTDTPASPTHGNLESQLSCDLSSFTPRSREAFHRSVASAYTLYANDTGTAGRRNDDNFQNEEPCSLRSSTSRSMYKMNKQITRLENKLDDTRDFMEDAVRKLERPLLPIGDHLKESHPGPSVQSQAFGGAANSSVLAPAHLPIMYFSNRPPPASIAPNPHYYPGNR